MQLRVERNNYPGLLRNIIDYYFNNKSQYPARDNNITLYWNQISSVGYTQ